MFGKERKQIAAAVDTVRDANTTALAVAGIAVVIAVIAVIVAVRSSNS